MKNKTNTIETILEEFDKRIVGDISAGSLDPNQRIINATPDEVKALLLSALRQVQEETIEEVVKDYYKKMHCSFDIVLLRDRIAMLKSKIPSEENKADFMEVESIKSEESK